MKSFRNSHEAWIRLPLREKSRRTLDRQHPPPSRCLLCEAAVMPADHATHRARCSGRREPHRLDTWLSEHEAAKRLELRTLRRLASTGRIRSRDGQYLLRDVETAADAVVLLT